MVEMTDAPPEIQEWLLDLPLTVGKPLGISVMENTGVLTSVHKVGIIPEMNEHYPELAVLPEDRITEVNGVAGDAVMLLKKSLARHDKALRLRILRPVRLRVSVDLDGDDLGIVVEKSTGTITAIRDGSIMARCSSPGLQIGDRVIAVNGREPGEDDSIMPWLRLALAGGVSPLELDLVRGSVPLEFFGNSIRGLESTRARSGSVPRPESAESESETETEDGIVPGDKPMPLSAQSTRSESPQSNASYATDEFAHRAQAGLLPSDKDRAREGDLFPPTFFNKTMSTPLEGRSRKVAPRVSRFARLRKLGERLILPHCAPFAALQKSTVTDSSSITRPSKEREFETTFLPPLDSRTSSKENQLVLPIVSLQATVQRSG
jgi:hypothetical protein